MHKYGSFFLCGVLLLTGCTGQGSATARGEARPAVAPAASAPTFAITEIATFEAPWAMTFLPDGRLLVTEKKGVLKLLEPGGKVADITGVPAVEFGGQGGLGDVVLHPAFASNGLVYLSYAEKGQGDTSPLMSASSLAAQGRPPAAS